MKILMWIELVVIVMPLTLLMSVCTLLLPFGAFARPEWIIPSYIGGLFGVYYFWEAFGVLVLGHRRNIEILLTSFTLGVVGLIWFLSKGHIELGSLRAILSGLSSLPILVGLHWAIQLYLIS